MSVRREDPEVRVDNAVVFTWLATCQATVCETGPHVPQGVYILL